MDFFIFFTFSSKQTTGFDKTLEQMWNLINRYHFTLMSAKNNTGFQHINPIRTGLVLPEVISPDLFTEGKSHRNLYSVIVCNDYWDGALGRD